MTPIHSDDWLTVHGGDARTVLSELPADSVHCVVTSPPYWGLRDYGTAIWSGGDPNCDHLIGPLVSSASTLASYTSENVKVRTNGSPFRGDCGKCGATRIDSQLGLEPTPEEYVANMVGVFREVRRVLRPDGTLWLNLGDSYAASNNTGGTASIQGSPKRIGAMTDRGHGIPAGLKPKDLVGIPWRVAFALQADGWYLRSDIIWAKPNPMPESVTDRPTKSHEYLFLLTRSARYWYDSAAVAEEADQRYAKRYDAPFFAGSKETSGNGRIKNAANTAGLKEFSGLRNLRTVWTVATAPYPGAHFATFPPKLVEPCIKAGCQEGGVVLDPFAGTGTVGMVAQRLSRRAVLIDLNPDYLRQCLVRNAQTPMGL